MGVDGQVTLLDNISDSDPAVLYFSDDDDALSSSADSAEDGGMVYSMPLWAEGEMLISGDSKP